MEVSSLLFFPTMHRQTDRGDPLPPTSVTYFRLIIPGWGDRSVARFRRRTWQRCMQGRWDQSMVVGPTEVTRVTQPPPPPAPED